ncbi:MAG TPA: NAD(P)H-hydrate dehydratase [Burkholderiales bacterium]|nr:NAD(P)H-hydrate dehydratase [Burkholderiales bacterium]
MSDLFATPQPIYLSRDIRKIEARAGPAGKLMEAAGLAAAELARDLLGSTGNAVLVFAGPGNNGGDALELARHLKQWWFKIEVVFTGDVKKLPRDAAGALRKWKKAGGTLRTQIPESKWDLVVDGLFGIGLARNLTGKYARLVERINHMNIPVLSLDVPSGLEADSGRIMGIAVRATHTATFIALKPGLLTLDGLDYSGEIHPCTLGINANSILPAPGWLLSKATCPRLKPRPRNSHKGLFGNAGIIGGAKGMVGAALLAGRAALKLGAGRTYVALLAENAPSADSLQPELMLRTPEELLALDHLNCLAVGPGLGKSKKAKEHLGVSLKTKLPLVLDADALNLIGADVKLRQLLKKRNAPTILTPHPAEAARLLGVSTQEIQHDRIASATGIAKRFNCHVVLKSAGSICALSDGSWYINSTGNPGMASAGMGDVLTGMIAALIAQGLNAGDAMLLAVYLHGAAADDLVARGVGPAGSTASEVTDAARNLLNQSISLAKQNAPNPRRATYARR